MLNHDFDELETRTTWTRQTTPGRVKRIRWAIEKVFKTPCPQERLAHLIGVSFATVNRWENGHTVPSGLAQVSLEKIEEKIEEKIKEKV